MYACCDAVKSAAGSVARRSDASDMAPVANDPALSNESIDFTSDCFRNRFLAGNWISSSSADSGLSAAEDASDGEIGCNGNWLPSEPSGLILTEADDVDDDNDAEEEEEEEVRRLPAASAGTSDDAGAMSVGGGGESVADAVAAIAAMLPAASSDAVVAQAAAAPVVTAVWTAGSMPFHLNAGFRAPSTRIVSFSINFKLQSTFPMS